MARHPKTTLWMLIKVVLKKRYVRVKKAANGRYIPAVIGTYEPGSYYLRYTLNRKRKWESVGSDLNIALQEQKARQASLELVPSATVTTLSTRKTVAEAITKFIANKNGADRHAQRRARGWKWLLDLFSNWWDKIYIDEFTREDFQAFQKYLAKKGRQPRTQCNLLRSLVTFFRASGRVVLFAHDEQEATILAATVVVKNTLILISADMPKFTKCKVTPYTGRSVPGSSARARFNLRRTKNLLWRKTIIRLESGGLYTHALMTHELKRLWAYIRAVVWHRWVIIIEGILGLIDITERIFHTWLLPPLWVSVTIGVAVLMVAQYLAYRDLQERLNSESQGEKKLEIRPSPGEVLNSFVETAHGETHYRVEIYNPETEPARNVQVKLIKIEPLPQSEYFRARVDFPYLVRLAHLADGIMGSSTSHDINPGDSRQFELLYFWESQDHRIMVAGIDTKQQFRDARFQIEENECWQMKYEVSSAHTTIKRPSFLVRREGMKLFMSRLV